MSVILVIKEVPLQLWKKTNDSRACPLSVALIAFCQCHGMDVFSLLLSEISDISFLLFSFQTLCKRRWPPCCSDSWTAGGSGGFCRSAVGGNIWNLFFVFCNLICWFVRCVTYRDYLLCSTSVMLLFKALKLATSAEHQGSLLKVPFFIKLFLMLATCKQLIHSCGFCCCSLGKDSRR